MKNGTLFISFIFLLCNNVLRYYEILKDSLPMTIETGNEKIISLHVTHWNCFLNLGVEEVIETLNRFENCLIYTVANHTPATTVDNQNDIVLRKSTKGTGIFERLISKVQSSTSLSRNV